MVPSIDIKTFKQISASAAAPILLDVRRKADYEQAPQLLPGATWRDPQKTEDWVRSLTPGSVVVTYCVKGGPVSQSVVERLQAEGFKASFLEGGFKAWVAGGNPVENVTATSP